MLIYLKNIIKLAARKLYRLISNEATGHADFRFYDVLEYNYKKGEPFGCIIVGANDGISHDNLYDFLIKRKSFGLAIEPLPDAFSKLIKNFAALPGVIKINLAVHPYLEKVKLYFVHPQKLNELPSWASGIASLKKDHYQKSFIPSEYITSIEVNADHLMNIVKKHWQKKGPDLLQIDAEGFDYEILKQIDFSELSPKIIRYEYFCLDKEDEQSAFRLVKSKGYFCFYDDVDVVCIKLRHIKL